ncbi:MAG: hypothetical protein WBQ94_18195 [Terracidiphilus sp.]
MSDRGEALRLAIYLDTAGLVPNCRECRTWDDAVAALSVQFFSLPSEVRRDAKANAGTIMSLGGMTAVGRAILPDHPLFNPTEDKSCQHPRPKCDHCRKATWDTHEAALEFCRSADLEPYGCPFSEGKWHIADKRNAWHTAHEKKEGIGGHMHMLAKLTARSGLLRFVSAPVAPPRLPGDVMGEGAPEMSVAQVARHGSPQGSSQ